VARRRAAADLPGVAGSDPAADRVTIESLDLEGRGVARRDGKVVFVAGALPGERAQIRILRAKPSYETARAIAIERASVERREPRCRHFGFDNEACGGCAMQHLEPRTQVAIKQRALEDTLWHIGRLRPQLMLRAIHGPAWGYRHRARLSVRDVTRKGGVLVGFHERASSYVADMRECPVLPDRVARLLLPLRELFGSLTIRRRLPQVEVAFGGGDDLVLVLRVLEPPSDDDRTLLVGFARRHRVRLWLQSSGPDSARPLTPEDAGELVLDLPEFGIALTFLPTDFTQVNHPINEVLVRSAVRLLGLPAGAVGVDFYCGLGNFTLPLAARGATVHGFEGSRALVERAVAAAQRNGLAQRTRFAARDLNQWSAADWNATIAEAGPVAGVLVDPPREGAPAIARTLADTTQPPGRLVYVSCNPATLARDSAVLVHEGGWTLRAAGVVNMFPQTSHVESIAVLEPPASAQGAPPGPDMVEWKA